MKKIIKSIKKPISGILQDVKRTGSLIIQGSSDYPPNVKKILTQYGPQIIKGITLKRTPVEKALTGALSLFSLGKFGERFEKSFDDLFHLYLELQLQNGTILLLEKIERINMEVNPKQRPDAEAKVISNVPANLSVYQLLETTKKNMGSQFFQYDAVVNNCQDFLLNVLKANGIGDERDYQFIKQDTAKLFKGMPILKSVAHTATEIGERANIIKQGGKIVGNGGGAQRRMYEPLVVQIMRENYSENPLSMYVINAVMNGSRRSDAIEIFEMLYNQTLQHMRDDDLSTESEDDEEQTQGTGLTKSSNIRNYGMILEHLVNHIKDPNEPIDPRDYRQGIKIINVIRQLKGSGLKKKSKKSLIVQSIVFPKDEWNVVRAKKWLREHNYKGLTVDRKPSTLRFRQEPPTKFKTFRMKSLNNGIMLVLAK